MSILAVVGWGKFRENVTISDFVKYSENLFSLFNYKITHTGAEMSFYQSNGKNVTFSRVQDKILSKTCYLSDMKPSNRLSLLNLPKKYKYEGDLLIRITIRKGETPTYLKSENEQDGTEEGNRQEYDRFLFSVKKSNDCSEMNLISNIHELLSKLMILKKEEHFIAHDPIIDLAYSTAVNWHNKAEEYSLDKLKVFYGSGDF